LAKAERETGDETAPGARLVHYRAILSGPCDTFTPPIKVAVGEFFIANGKRRQIGIIVGSQADQDVLEDGLDVRKGEGTCIAGLKTCPEDGAIVN